MKRFNPVLRFFLGLVIRALGEKDRRTFCLASLFYYLSDKDFYKGSSVNLESLTSALNLSPDRAMLELPRATSALVWGDVLIPAALANVKGCALEHCPTLDEATRLAEEMVSLSPSWLRYKHTTMVQDIVKQIYLTQPA